MALTFKDSMKIINDVYNQAKEHKTFDSYDIVGAEVVKFWHETYPRNVIAFFEQKYSWEDKWSQCEELITCNSDYEYTVVFENDFCEGQTDVRNVTIVPLDEITTAYRKHVIEPLAIMKGARNE